MGRRYHTPLFQLIHTPHDTFHGAVVVSKKVEKLAVKRNLLRRRAYDCVRRLRGDGVLGVYILIAKKEAHSAPYEAIKESIGALVRQTTKVR